MRPWPGVLACLLALHGRAQWDSLYYAAPDNGDLVTYHGGFDFREGVYFTFGDFRKNAPAIALERLLDAQGRPVGDLRGTDGRLQYHGAGGALVRLDMDRLWGFCDGDVVYVRSGNGFNRIGLMGSLAHLVFDATYRNWGWYDPMWGGMGPTSYTVQEQRLLDMRTGAFLPVNAAGMRQALQDDPLLLTAFEALPRRTRDKEATLFQFMRRYNERHPLSFPR
jgi:hypothetical protein